MNHFPVGLCTVLRRVVHSTSMGFNTGRCCVARGSYCTYLIIMYNTVAANDCHEKERNDCIECTECNDGL